MKEIQELKEQFDLIISKYKFNEGSKTQELVEYIISKEKHSAEDLAKEFSIELDEAIVLLTFFQKGLEFKKSVTNSEG